MRAFIGLLIFVASLWIIEIADTLGNFGLENYGILPRNVTGLRGIPLSVFLHADFNHLISNTAPLIVLGGLISMRGAKRLLASSVFITLVSGAFVWLMAGVVSGYGIHIGASGLVFGYFGYLAARGLYERSLNSIIISVVVIVLYGTIIFGIIPTDEFVSWEGHLFGLIAGVLYAGLVGKEAPKPDADEASQRD